MDKATLQAIAERVAATADERRRVRELVAQGRWRDAEPNVARARAFAARTALGGRHRAESIVGETEDFQRVSFLSLGARRSRAVAYVEVNDGTRAELGTGFLVSDALFITNQHVIRNADAARGAQLTFDRELGDDGRFKVPTTYVLDPGRLALFSPEAELDYALIAIGERRSGPATLAELGFLPLSNTPDRHQLGMNCNIVQHPGGLPKLVTVRNNILTDRTPRTLLYETDTDNGSSGSPVLNDDWEVVALHHWGQPSSDADLPRDARRNVNEGIRISAIFDELTRRLATLDGEQRALLGRALSVGTQATAVGVGPVFSPPRPSAADAAPVVVTAAPAAAATLAPPPVQQESSMNTTPPAGATMRFTIPIEVTVSVPGAWAAAAPAAVAAPGAAPGPAPRTLTRGPETVQLDQDYSNRSGYDPAFIAGVKVPLPTASATLARQIAPLRAGEPGAASGELKYEHFSLKLHKGKRIALFTATNIDGARYLQVDRLTGEVNASEAEVWFKDPRVSASFFLDQTFYSAWSTYFDRGHLTRRTDPTWGSAAEAERANADTFHFTNCSPQHFRFNQSARFWQGLERYVLENGVLANDTRRRLSVFQGPIFNDKIDLWADDVQIPSSFFKVVVWKSPAGLKAVGLVADQLQLLAEPRRSLATPQALQAVDVNHWRVAIADIERRTGLNFGAAVRRADTMAQAGQPQVGEAAVLVKDFAAITL